MSELKAFKLNIEYVEHITYEMEGVTLYLSEDLLKNGRPTTEAILKALDIYGPENLGGESQTTPGELDWATAFDCDDDESKEVGA